MTNHVSPFSAILAGGLLAILAACSSGPAALPTGVGVTPSGATATTAASATGAPTASGPAASTPADGAIVNCQTISGDDIATIIGKDLAGASPFGDIQCTWTFTGGAGAESDRTVVVRWANDDTTLAAAKSAYPGGEDLSLGDRGYWADSVNILYVAKGTHAYAIDLPDFDADEPRKDFAIAIAQLLLAAL